MTKVACKVWRKPLLIKCDGGQTWRVLVEKFCEEFSTSVCNK